MDLPLRQQFAARIAKHRRDVLVSAAASVIVAVIGTLLFVVLLWVAWWSFGQRWNLEPPPLVYFLGVALVLFFTIGYAEYRKDLSRPALHEHPDYLVRGSVTRGLGALPFLLWLVALPSLVFHLGANILDSRTTADDLKIEDLAFDIATKTRRAVTIASLRDGAEPEDIEAAVTLLEQMGFLRRRLSPTGETEIFPSMAHEAFFEGFDPARG